MGSQSTPSRAQLFLAAVGEQILIYREAAGLGLDEVARRTGIPSERLDQIEHGWSDVTLTDLQAVANAIGASVNELLDVAGSELGSGLAPQ